MIHECFEKAAKGIELAWRHNPVAVVIIVLVTVLAVMDFGLIMFILGAISAG